MKRGLAAALLTLACTPVAAAPLAGTPAALAAAPAATPDSRLHCFGGERAGSASGVAAFSGRWLERWPGLGDPKAWSPGPYAEEKPLFTITAANLASYAARLSEGQKALFARYPQQFRMPVYTSHRDFGIAPAACAAAQRNAASARLEADGLRLAATTAGAPPFPQPRDGLQAIWNVLATRHVWNETATIDIASVYANGAIAWGKQRYMTLSPNGDPSLPAGTAAADPKVGAWFRVELLQPQRDRGTISVGVQPIDYTGGSTQVWVYSPGTRRLRQAPDIAFDYPVPPGLRTVDDDHLFNGSPERYAWTLLGKRELYVPYNGFQLDNPALRYAEMLKPGSLNPDVMRYELHRVWVIEGRLKPGLRHVYGRRVLYVDEDSWLALWADHYDLRGKLWRTAFVNYRYAPDAQAFHRGVSVFHDLDAGAYEAAYLVNEAGAEGWRLNRSDMKPEWFSPNAAARGGH